MFGLGKGTDDRARRRSGHDFSEACRRVLATAREEARRLGHPYVGTEHMLLALTDHRDLMAALRLDAQVVRRIAEEQCKTRRRDSGGGEDLPYTSRAKKAIELAMEEAAEASSCVGVEHLLLGLLREERGVGALVLAECGVTLRSARRVFRDTSASGQSATFRVELDDASEQSIYEQIVGQIQEGIATAKLLPGERLPTVRQMADDLDVAPGTVARAYGELERVGAVETDGVRGTRVAQQQGPSLSAAARGTTLVSLLRPVAVAAFHLGASAADVRRALDHAMKGIFEQDNAA